MLTTILLHKSAQNDTGVSSAYSLPEVFKYVRLRLPWPFPIASTRGINPELLQMAEQDILQAWSHCRRFYGDAKAVYDFRKYFSQEDVQ